jgi:hypothetical protein
MPGFAVVEDMWHERVLVQDKAGRVLVPQQEPVSNQ